MCGGTFNRFEIKWFSLLDLVKVVVYIYLASQWYIHIYTMIAQVVCPRMKHWQPDFLHPFSTPGFRAEEANEGLFPLIHKHTVL